MRKQSVKFTSKTLNYEELKELLEKVSSIQDLEKIAINISYCERENNAIKTCNKVFNDAESCLEYIKKLNKIEEFEIHFNPDKEKLEWIIGEWPVLCYSKFDNIWELKYNEEDNFVKVIIYTLVSYFKPNSRNKLIIIGSFLLFAVGLVLYFISKKYGLLESSIWLFVIGAFVFAISVYLKTILRYRNIPYRNCKFWEKHKVDIIQNIIFYVLGIITPYLITLIINFIR